MTALAFWSHGFPMTDESVPGAGARRADGHGGRRDGASARLGPSSPSSLSTAVQHSLQRQLRYEAATESARHRSSWQGVRATSASSATATRSQPGTRTISARSRRRASIGLEGYDAAARRRPHLRRSLPYVDAAAPAFYLGDWDAVLRDFELIVAGLGELAEELTSGFAARMACCGVRLEARGNHEAADRLLEEMRRVETRRGGRVRTN